MGKTQQERAATARESLGLYLAPLAFIELRRPDATQLITKEGVAWAHSHGFKTTEEAQGTATRRTRSGLPRGSLLDVDCVHPTGQRISIEIDAKTKSGRSRNSLSKPAKASSRSG